MIESIVKASQISFAEHNILTKKCTHVDSTWSFNKVPRNKRLRWRSSCMNFLLRSPTPSEEAGYTANGQTGSKKVTEHTSGTAHLESIELSKLLNPWVYNEVYNI